MRRQPRLRSRLLILAIALAPAPLLAAPGLAGAAGDLSPIRPEEWSVELAAHLLERAGFGGTPEEIAALHALGPREAVRRLVRYQEVTDVELEPFVESGIFPAPDWSPSRNSPAFRHILFGTLDQLPPDQRAKVMHPSMTGVEPEDERAAATDKQAVVDKFYYWKYVDLLELARAETWLAERMLRTRRPLQEKLVLFWHGHFATSNDKVRDYRKMLGQFTMLRQHANGSLRDLLIGISQDPAMLVYLDNHQNHAGHPNENYAREIFELFSLGVGNYTETDIREAARAFTGWTLDASLMRFEDRPDLHDDGSKTVLGRTGQLDGEDVVDVILEQEACARFVGGKLYRFFVREPIDDALLDQIAAILRQADYEVAPLLERLFLSRDFYSDASYAARIQSPVELTVSTWRKLGLTEAPTWPSFSQSTGALGQRVFQPPNVKGWDGGRTWINPSTLLQRQNLLRYLLFPEEAPRVADAHLAGSRRLSGDFIHEQFLAGAARGDFASFPQGGGMAMAATATAGDADPSPTPIPPSAAEETMKLSGEDFNLFRGVFNAAWRSWERIGPEPRRVARFRVADWLRAAQVSDAEGAVDYLLRRFVRVPLDPDRRRSLVEFLESELAGERLDLATDRHETALRELLHLIMSCPEYQLV
jgi:hypothetical protein